MAAEKVKKLSGPHFSDAEFIAEYSREYHNNGSVRSLSSRMKWQFAAIKKRFAKLAKFTPELNQHVLPLFKQESKQQSKDKQLRAQEAAAQDAAQKLLESLRTSEG